MPPFLVHYPIFNKFVCELNHRQIAHIRPIALRGLQNFDDHRNGPAFRNPIFLEADFLILTVLVWHFPETARSIEESLGPICGKLQNAFAIECDVRR